MEREKMETGKTMKPPRERMTLKQVRLPAEVCQKIKDQRVKLGLREQDALRLALCIGLQKLENRKSGETVYRAEPKG